MQLICPACRKVSERGLLLHTVDPAGPDLLRCRGCAREYPVIDGIPVLLRDLSRADHFGLLAALGPPQALAALGSAGPDETPLPHMLDQLSTYLETWRTGFDALAEKLRGRPRVALSLEMGCGVGRALFEMSRSAERAVGRAFPRVSSPRPPASRPSRPAPVSPRPSASLPSAPPLPFLACPSQASLSSRIGRASAAETRMARIKSCGGSISLMNV